MTTGREASPRARLARLGFADTDSVTALLAQHPILDARLEAFRDTADPDSAITAVGRILATGAVDVAVWNDTQWHRVASVCAASIALAEHLARHPTHATYVATIEGVPTPPEMHANLYASVRDKSWDDALPALRVAYRREVCAIAGLDLAARGDSVAMLPGIAHALADLADAVVAAALALSKATVPGGGDVNLAVIAMGKCGARELNYISDVDVMFVSDVSSDAATAVAQSVMRACSEHTSEGAIWEVDAALRPEGKAGALVRTLESYLDYYERWAQSWEYQALLKARVMAGDADLGDSFCQMVADFVWRAADRPGFVESVQAMRERVTELIPAKDADRELKLGRGGLRDVEFAVQLLQLVHGRSDAMVRSPNTLLALEQLATWGYVGREDAAALAQAYRFLRALEHRIQLWRMRRTHLMPSDEGDLARLGRSLGLGPDPVEELVATWRKHAREVRRIHEKLFYRPLLDAVARLSVGDARLTTEAAGARLAVLGFADPEGALRHLEALTNGVSRRAVIQRTLLPVMLDWFAQSPDPDAAILGFRKVSEALGATPWYLRLLRDESITAQRLAAVLGTSRYATDLLLRAPEAVRILADDLAPRDRAELIVEARAIASRHPDPVAAVTALRAMRRRELFRLASASVLEAATVDSIARGISAITDAVIEGALVALHQDGDPAFVVMAMGRYGGGELGFGSDADVMFCYDESGDDPGGRAHRLAGDLRALLMAPSTDPELVIDADLRPEGKNGPLERSLESYRAYYSRWSSGWESQALLRADTAAGDAALGAEFLAMVDPLRYAPEGLSAAALGEIRRLKARMESERLPRGIEPQLHFKLGPGGLSDVEWVVQIFQMQHAYALPELRTPRTLDALRAAQELGVIDRADAATLEAAWLFATRVRNMVMLVRGRGAESLPTDVLQLAQVAAALGYGPRAGQQLREDYLRTMRRSRAVTMRLLFGQSD